MSSRIESKVVAVYSKKAEEHNPPFELWRGLRDPHYDKPAISEAISRGLTELVSCGLAKVIEPRTYSVEKEISAVHSLDYIAYLKWLSNFLSTEKDIPIAEIVDLQKGISTIKMYKPFAFPFEFHRETAGHQNNHRLADLGLFCNDTGTPVMANTYEVAVSSALTAITATDLVLEGNRIAYAGSRPPGHHAERSKMGGYCYFNNASIAAQRLLNKTGKNVAIIDIDAHHGNGTQQIFYDSDKVSYASLHVDTKDTAPYFTGHESETGRNEGNGHNKNIPLHKETSDSEYLSQLDKALYYLRQQNPSYLVVSLGFDGHRDDPLHIFNLTTDGYRTIAKKISSLELPTIIVQEGGYDIHHINDYLIAFLKEFAERHSEI